MATERLDGTVALVTGASSGIGEATARELARQGAAVAIVARRRDRLDTLAAEITAAGGEAIEIETDITEQAQASAWRLTAGLPAVRRRGGVAAAGRTVSDRRVYKLTEQTHLRLLAPRRVDSVSL